MTRLLAFLLLAELGGAAIVDLSLKYIVPGLVDPEMLLGLFPNLLVGAFLVLFTTPVASFLRARLGGLSGFALALTGICCSLAVLQLVLTIVMTNVPRPVFVLVAQKLTGPLLLAQVGPLRRWASLGPSFRGVQDLAGTYALMTSATEAPAAALGRYPAEERRSVNRSARIVTGDDDAAALLGRPPRRVPTSLKCALLLGRRGAFGWAWLALGFVALWAWLGLDCVREVKLRGARATASARVESSVWRPLTVGERLLYARGSMCFTRYRFSVEGRTYETVGRSEFRCYDGPAKELTYAVSDPSVNSLIETREIVVWPIGLALLALGLWRAGLLRLRDSMRIIRVLRDGDLVLAVPDPTRLPDSPRAMVATAEVGGERLVVVVPAPANPPAKLPLLVDRRRDVVAWNLLPYLPEVASGGELRSPPMREILPWILGPAATLLAAARAFL